MASSARGSPPFGHLSLLYLRTTWLDALPNSMGLKKWSLKTTEEPGEGGLDEVVNAPVHLVGVGLPQPDCRSPKSTERPRKRMKRKPAKA